MALSAVHIALQGVGAGALTFALQGLWPTTTVAPPPVEPYTTHSWRTKPVRRPVEVDIQAQNELIIATAVAALVNGLLE